jgi:hypothetical protein
LNGFDHAVAADAGSLADNPFPDSEFQECMQHKMERPGVDCTKTSLTIPFDKTKDTPRNTTSTSTKTTNGRTVIETCTTFHIPNKPDTKECVRHGSSTAGANALSFWLWAAAALLWALCWSRCWPVLLSQKFCKLPRVSVPVPI